MKKKIYRAGLLPYHIDEQTGEIEILFMRPSNPKFGGKEFQIAKGKIDDDDLSSKDAAVREAREELGLRETNMGNVWYLGTFMGRTRLYVTEVFKKDAFDEPCFETGETRWMSLKEFMDEGRPLHKSIVKRAFHKIYFIL